MCEICFNNEQQKLIDLNTGKNTFITGYAGTGKTTVIVSKIKQLYESNHKSNILVLTTENNKIDFYKNNLNTILSCKNNIEIRTIHNLAIELLGIITFSNNRLISNIDKYNVLKGIYEKYKKVDKFNYKLLKKDITAYSNYLNDSISIYNGYTLIDSLVKEYNIYLRRNNLFDFDTLFQLVFVILRNRQEFIKSIRSRYDYIVIDDLHRFTKSQLYLLYLIQNDNLFAAYDTNKLCNVESHWYIRDFISSVNGDVKTLSTNYRVNIDLINKLLLDMDYVKSINPKNTLIEVREVNNTNKILTNCNKVVKYSEHKTVLYYYDLSNALLMIDKLLNKDIDFCINGNVLSFTNLYFIKEMLAFIKLSMLDTDVDAYHLVRHTPIYYMSNSKSYGVEKMLRNSGCTVQYAIYTMCGCNNRLGAFIDSIQGMRPIYLLKRLKKLYCDAEKYNETIMNQLIVLSEKKTAGEFLVYMENLLDSIDKHTMIKTNICISSVKNVLCDEYDTAVLMDSYDIKLNDFKKCIYTVATSAKNAIIYKLEDDNFFA